MYQTHEQMNIPAFDASLMLEDFVKVTKTSNPFWLGIHRDNVEGENEMKK